MPRQFPGIAEILDAIESRLSDENRDLLRDNLTQRAFRLGVLIVLSEIYSDTESKRVLTKYAIKTFVETMCASDRLWETPGGEALRAFEGIVQEALVVRGSAKVTEHAQALDDVLTGRLRRFCKTVHESQGIISEISSLVGGATAVAGASDPAESGYAESKRRVLDLLEALRQRVERIETRGTANWMQA